MLYDKIRTVRVRVKVHIMLILLNQQLKLQWWQGWRVIVINQSILSLRPCCDVWRVTMYLTQIVRQKRHWSCIVIVPPLAWLLTWPVTWPVGCEVVTLWLLSDLMDLKKELGVLSHYLSLAQPEDKVQCTYVWIDGTGESLRSKTKTVAAVPKTPRGKSRSRNHHKVLTETWWCHDKFASLIQCLSIRTASVEFRRKLLLPSWGEQFWCLPSSCSPLQGPIQVRLAERSYGVFNALNISPW